MSAFAQPLAPTDEQQEIIDVFADGSDLVVEAGAGCLAADTILNVNRGGGQWEGRGNGRQVSIENVALQVAGKPLMRRAINGKTFAQSARRWDLSIPTYLARADGDVSRLGKMERAWFSGVKHTFEIRTESGRSIRATAEHPFLVDGGTWAALGEIDSGHRVYVNAGRSARGSGRKLQYRSVVTRFHPFQVNDSNGRVKFKVPLHRAIIEAEINGLSLDRFLSILRTDAVASASLHFLGREWHVHHRDRNTLNNERTNLELLTEEEHRQLHAREGTTSNVLWQIGLERVVAVRHYGEEETFDVAMADEPHNFLANGFVVHNTGKSSTLRMLGQSTQRRGMVLYFNKAPAVEAQASFPSHVRCSTAHSLAFRAMADRPCVRRLGGPPVPARSLAEDFLGIRSWFTDVPKGRKAISSWKIASLAVQTIRRFCYSSDEEVKLWHVPRVEGIVDDYEKNLRDVVLPFAREIWADLQKPDGFARFEHDHYMKMWALEGPKIESDWLAVDESQDTNGVLAGVVRQQDHIQRVLVGDSNQRLFQWRGSVDIMHEFDEAEVRYLTQSFRFGDAVAEEANRWLGYLAAPLRLRGLSSIASRLEFVEQPDAVLCRTNADVIEQAMSAQSRGMDVAVVGGTSEVSSFASAADELRRTGKTRHPELSVFKSWSDVQAYVRDEQPGGNFATAVKLIERYGTAQIISVAARCVEPRDADYVVSTVHKVKGMEWDKVLLDPGLMPDDASDGAEMTRGELMVDYVASTRAREVLDATALEPFHRRRARQRDLAQKSAS